MLPFGVHLFHHVRGPAFDYVGLGLAAFASWAGLPGPGEALLLAAGVFAAKHKLDITPVLVVAFVAATVGGITGWLVGLIAGRSVLTAPGPLRSIRLDATERGEQTFKRVEAVAILLTPSWVAGIFHARPGIYNLINALSAAVWAVTIGVGGYYVGPLVVEVVDDLGTVGLILAIAIVGVALATTLIRRQRGAERRTAERESA
jgi:membrane protein DedA with SNARE-associated domain